MKKQPANHVYITFGSCSTCTFHISNFSFTFKYNLTCMWAIFGQFCVSAIFSRPCYWLHWNENEKSLSWKGLLAICALKRPVLSRSVVSYCWLVQIIMFSCEYTINKSYLKNANCMISIDFLLRPIAPGGT